MVLLSQDKHQAWCKSQEFRHRRPLGEATRDAAVVRQHATAGARRAVREAVAQAQPLRMPKLCAHVVAATGNTEEAAALAEGPGPVRMTRADVAQQTATTEQRQAVRKAEQPTANEAQQQDRQQAPTQSDTVAGVTTKVPSQHARTAEAQPGKVSLPRGTS